MQAGQKRKRDAVPPRITFHAAERTFERLFKEESLGELRSTIKAKLGLSKHSDIVLKQLRNGKTIDLEDEDDFDAFHLVAHSQAHVEVQISTEKSGHRPSQLEPSRHKSVPPEPISTRFSTSGLPFSKKPRSEAHPSARAKSQPPQTPAKRPLSAVAGPATSGTISVSAGPAPKKQKVNELDHVEKRGPGTVTFDDDEEYVEDAPTTKKGRRRSRHKKPLSEPHEDESTPVTPVEPPEPGVPVPPEVPSEQTDDPVEQPPKKKKKKKQKATALPNEESHEPTLDPAQPASTVEEPIDMPPERTIPEPQVVESSSEPPKKRKKKERQTVDTRPAEEEEPQPVNPESVQEKVRIPSSIPQVEDAAHPTPAKAPFPREATPEPEKRMPTTSKFRFDLSPNDGTPRTKTVRNSIYEAYEKVLAANKKQAAAFPLATQKSKAETYKPLLANTTDTPAVISGDGEEEVQTKPKRKASKAVKKKSEAIFDPDKEELEASGSELPVIVVRQKPRRKVSEAVKNAEPSAEEPLAAKSSVEEIPAEDGSSGLQGSHVVVELKTRKRKASQAATKGAGPLEESPSVEPPQATDSTEPPAVELTKRKRRAPKGAKDAIPATDPPVAETSGGPDTAPASVDDEKSQRRKSIRGKKPAPVVEEQPVEDVVIVPPSTKKMPSEKTHTEPEPATSTVDVISARPTRPKRKSKATREDNVLDTAQPPVEPEPHAAPSEDVAPVNPKPKRKSRGAKASTVEESALEETAAAPSALKAPKASEKDTRASEQESEADNDASIEHRPPRLLRASKKPKTPAFVHDSEDEASAALPQVTKVAPVSTVELNTDTENKPAKLSRGMKRRAQLLASPDSSVVAEPSRARTSATSAITMDINEISMDEPSLAELPETSMQVDGEVSTTTPIITEPISPAQSSETVVENPVGQPSEQSQGEQSSKSPTSPSIENEDQTSEQPEAASDKVKKSVAVDVSSRSQSPRITMAQPIDEEGVQKDGSESDVSTPSSVGPTSRKSSPSRASSPDPNLSQFDPAFPFSFSLPAGSGVADIANIDLDELIRGPPTSQISGVELLSSPESSDEESDEDEPQELLEEDMEEPRAARRLSHKPVVMDSSDEENSDDETPASDTEQEPPSRLSWPETPVQHDRTFMSVDRMVESERELDNVGDIAFHSAFAADEEPMQHINGGEKEATPRLDIVESKEEVIAEGEETVEHEAEMEEQEEGKTLEQDVVEMQQEDEVEKPTFQIVTPPIDGIDEDTGNTEKSDSNEREPSVAEQLPTPDGSEINEDEPQPSQRAKLRTRGKGRTPETSTPMPTPATQTGTRSTKKTLLKATPKPLQALSSYAPPQLVTQAANGRQLRSHKKTTASQDSVVGASQWEILKPAATSSPGPDGDFSQMVDELNSDAPDLANQASDAEYPLKRPPLFVLTESQPPFPYSQWQGDSQTQSQSQENATAGVAAKEDDAIMNDSEDETGEVEASVTPAIRRTQSTSKFRRLTDIARDHSMFSTPRQRRLSRASLLGRTEKKEDLYGRARGDEESESDSDSGEDSDNQAVSHIPRNRRAGFNKAKK